MIILKHNTSMTDEQAHFYLSKTEPNRSALLALKDIILEQDTAVTETRKYGMPCFCFKNKAFCYLWVDKKTEEPYLLMVEGKHLEHPALETGKRARMKIFRIDPNQDLPLDSIHEVLREALDLYRKGVVRVR